MAILPVFGLPGVNADRTATQRRVFKQSDYETLAGGGIIDGANARDPLNGTDVVQLEAGLLMGLITATKKWAPSILGVTTGALTAGLTSISGAAATITELVRRIGATGTFTLVGPPTAGGTVNSEVVTYSAASGTTITVTAILNAYVAGAFIMPTDGSQTPLSLIPDGFPCRVVDYDGNNVQTEWPAIPIGGVIDAAQVLNYPSDASLKVWLMNRLNGPGGNRFVFDTIYTGN